MIVYHCSLVSIKQFVFNEKGVHFGGKQSAIEAALRKTASNDDNIFVHKCWIDSNDFFDCEDQGNHNEWIKTIEYAISDGYSVICYNNRYEPDFKPSYIVLNKEIVKIVSISQIKAINAEKEILDYLY